MSQLPPLLITLLTLVTLLCSKSLPLDPNYVACTPFECGGINITYPFVVTGHQAVNCGVPGFEILCKNSTPIINLSSAPYIINSISYERFSVNITNLAFSHPVLGCLGSIDNLTHDDARFNYPADLKMLFLLQDCQTSVSRILSKPETIKCKDYDNQNRSGSFLAVYEEDFDPLMVGGECKRVVQVPYQDEDGGVSDVEEVLKKGIVLNYITINCSLCRNSGGRCGFNASISELVCFCPDRPHKVSCRRNRKQNLGIILGTVLPGCLLIILAVLILYLRQRKIKRGSSTLPSRTTTLNWTRSDLEEGSVNGLTVFSYSELEEATNTFDSTRELGEGGFGIVYHGKLKDGREVAVKRLYEKNFKRIEQFKNEVHILTGLRHKNLVTLYGCTSRHSRELLLVYEYIPNGTVADHLHGDHAKSALVTWSTRMNIAIETAEALSYLHFKDIIHRDVKTNNLLLDNNYCVKVGDFGLSRLFPADATHVSTAPQGTPGYLDPEYHQCYHLTDKSDVYSFGVVLIELISSLPAVDVGRHRHEINLSNYAMNKIQCCAFNELVDPNLGFETDFKVRRMTTLVAELAFQCLQQERDLRPSMEEVLKALKRIVSVDYDALEAEEMGMSTGTTEVMKSLSSSTNNSDVGLMRNAKGTSASPDSVTGNSTKSLSSSIGDDDFGFLRNSQQPPSPDSITDEWFSKSTKPPPSPTDNDDVGLLRNAQQNASSSPDSVMYKWLSKSSTPNTSS